MIVNEKQIEYIVSLIETRKKTYDEISAGTGVSKSTISRLMKQRQATKYTIDMLASYFEVGDEMISLGEGGEQTNCPLIAGVSGELKRLEGVYSERETRLQAQCDERIAAMKLQMSMLQEHHAQALTNRDNTYERSVDYLKKQVAIMQEERRQNQEEIESQRKRAEVAETHVEEIDKRRHNVFWGMLSVIILLLIFMIIMICVDAPGIGLGWK